MSGGVFDSDVSLLRPDLIGGGRGICWLNLVLVGVLGLLGLRGIRQKLPDRGLADVGDDLDIADLAADGILSRPSAVAGSLTFSPNDSLTVRRADLEERKDRGDWRG